MITDRRLHAPASHARFPRLGELTNLDDLRSDLALERERFQTLECDHRLLKAQSAQRESALAESEQQLRFSQKAGRLGSWTLDLDTMRLAASDGCKDNFGRNRSDPFSYEAWIDAVHPDDQIRMQSAKEACITDRTDYDIEYRIITPAGEVRWIQSRGQAAYRPDGIPLGMTGISLDITDRKRAEEHRDVLALELGHRVKNTLATVQSIVRQTLRKAPSLDAAMHTIEGRIQSLVAAHDLLMRESWREATLGEVVEAALRPFGIDQFQRFSVAGPLVALPSRHALAFAMAIHELATNATKYGALSNDVGQVFLSWNFVDQSRRDWVRLEWLEVGGPLVCPPTRTGFGSRIIGSVLSAGICGTSKIDYCPEGVRFTAETQVPAPD